MNDWPRTYPTDRGQTNSSYSLHGTRPAPTSYAAGSNETRGADLIAEYLVKEKVPYILGYAGHGAIGLLDGIYKQTDRIRHISPRIEQAAGFMADVYYRLTGQPLAVYASTGPGPMNLMISVANAYYDCSAFFVITGQRPDHASSIPARCRTTTAITATCRRCSRRSSRNRGASARSRTWSRRCRTPSR